MLKSYGYPVPIVAAHYLGVQQSPAEAAAVLARPPRSQLVFSTSTSPKCLARKSQVTAMSKSLIDRPLGLCVVQRMNVVL